MKNSHDTELIDAINLRDLGLVKAAIESGGNIEAPDQHGCAGLPLRRACFLGFQEIVIELLQRGANPNAANADGPGASLRMAQRGGHTTICTLLQQYALLNQANESVNNTLAHTDHQDLFEEHFSSKREPKLTFEESAKVTDPTKNLDVLLDFNFEPEATKPGQASVTEYLEIEACYGVDTKLLLEDVARITNTENLAQNTPATNTPKSSGFWQRNKK